jgi:hypothetical protein
MPIIAQSLGNDAQFKIISPIFNAYCRTLSVPHPVPRCPPQPPARVMADRDGRIDVDILAWRRRLRSSGGSRGLKPDTYALSKFNEISDMIFGGQQSGSHSQQ